LIHFLPQIATSIYTVLDKTMLGIITQSEAENGYYEQTYKIIQISLIVITSLNAVMAPRMAYLFGKGEKKEFCERLKASFHFLFMLAVPIVLALLQWAQISRPSSLAPAMRKCACFCQSSRQSF
jgi:O-antigen/teichoic acid export membrane protein